MTKSAPSLTCHFLNIIYLGGNNDSMFPMVRFNYARGFTMLDARVNLVKNQEAFLSPNIHTF